MTEVTEIKKIARAIGSALKSKGYAVPHSVMLHALAAVKGDTNWHVLCARTEESVATLEPSPVSDSDLPLTRLQLLRTPLREFVVSNVPEAVLRWDIDARNDYFSERITGSIVALTDIGYTTVSVGASDATIKVSGQVDFTQMARRPDELIACEYTSRWDEGDVTTSAKVSLVDGAVIDIEMSNFVPDSDCLGELITVALPKGTWSFEVTDESPDGEPAIAIESLLQLREATELFGVSSSSGMSVTAEAHTDDHAFEVPFDAGPWLHLANEEAVLNLVNDDFGGNYGADQVAEDLASSTTLADYTRKLPAKADKLREAQATLNRMFDYLGDLPDGKSCGFEVHVDREEAMAYLKTHRPGLWAKALCALHQVSLVEAEEPEILGRWDWLDDQGNASEGSLESATAAAWNAVRCLHLEEREADAC